MRLKRHVPLLQSLLKQRGHLPPLPPTQCLYSRRHYAPSLATYPHEIAILGGGISGLASAHFVSKEFPKSKITIFESRKEVGGWIKSSKIKVPGGDIVFEHGPRTLRPTPTSALATLQLIQDLDLNTQVLCTSKDEAAAQNRYIYYPDQINKLPNSFDFANLFSLFRSGLLDGTWNLPGELLKPRRDVMNLQDESVGDFIARRWDKRVADNLASAVLHGIYAGDIYQLSARTLLERFWELERRFQSVIRGLNELTVAGVHLWHPYDWHHYKLIKEQMDIDPAILKTLKSQSTFYFKEGMEQLPRAIAKSLRSNEQVEILTSTAVHANRPVEEGSKIEITTGSKSSPVKRTFDFVICTLPKEDLTPSVTTMVVNLWFKDPKLVPIHGFGYLIPRTIPFAENPERALGVIFDHDATAGQDSIPGTKLTVMLGGHWWDGWSEYPDQEEGAVFARSILQRHLGITAEPDEIQVTLNKNCIPQYTVGYAERAIGYHRRLQNKYKGRFRVVGSQFNGVGVNDCITGAWQMAANMKNGGWEDNATGLERHASHDSWVVKSLPSLTKRPPISKSNQN